MSTIPIEARSLPLYKAGLSAGVDVRLALDSLCGELATQDRHLAEQPDSASPTAARSLSASCVDRG